MQSMLDLFSKYGDWWNIMHTGNLLYKYTQLCFQLGKDKLDAIQRIKYLGIEVCDNFGFDAHIEKKLKEVQRSYFALYN
jgi:hypothetical protein